MVGGGRARLPAWPAAPPARVVMAAPRRARACPRPRQPPPRPGWSPARGRGAAWRGPALRPPQPVPTRGSPHHKPSQSAGGARTAQHACAFATVDVQHTVKGHVPACATAGGRTGAPFCARMGSSGHARPRLRTAGYSEPTSRASAGASEGAEDRAPCSISCEVRCKQGAQCALLAACIYQRS